MKIFDHAQGKRIGLQYLRLSLDNHVYFEGVGRGIRAIRLDAQSTGGLFLYFDLSHRPIAASGNGERQDRKQKECGKADVDDGTPSSQHHTDFAQGELGRRCGRRNHEVRGLKR